MNVCSEIECPYFEPSSKASYGCQRYHVASACHLKTFPEVELDDNQYVLNGDFNRYQLKLLARANLSYFLKDEKYQSDLQMQQTLPDLDVRYPTRNLTAGRSIDR